MEGKTFLIIIFTYRIAVGYLNIHILGLLERDINSLISIIWRQAGKRKRDRMTKIVFFWLGIL